MDINKLCPRCMREVLGEKKVFCTHCGYDLRNTKNEMHQLQPFTVLNGKYTVGKVIGEGGFGITYLGLDNVLEMRVAIKEFYPNGFVTRESNNTSSVTIYEGKKQNDFEKWRDNFLKEAKNLARFSGLSGIVEVREFFSENNTVYIVMEYVDGITLKDYLKNAGGKIPLDQVLRMMEPIMRSLAKVHESGLIHRDISPDNIMINKNGEMKLLDFGAARDISENGDKSLSILLKPGYAPEEQYRTRGSQGPWTDVYAISATIYKCITGQTPIESMERLRNDDLIMPRALGVPVSESFESILKMGLAVYADKRFQNMGALYTALYREANTFDANMTGIPVPPARLNNTTASRQQQTGMPMQPQDRPQPTSQPMPQPPLQQPRAAKKSNLPIYIFIAMAVVICSLGAVGIYRIAGKKTGTTGNLGGTTPEKAGLAGTEGNVAAALTEDVSSMIEQADGMVQAAAEKVKDAATRGEGLTELQEAIKLYEEAGEEEAAFEAAQAGIDEALLSYVEGILLQSDMLMEQGTSIDLFDQIMMDIDDTLLYGQGIEGFGYTIDLSDLENKKEAYAAEYRERFIEEFNGFIEEEQWNVRHNEEFMRGAYEKLATEDENDAIRLRYCYAYAWLVHQEVVEKMSSGEMDAEAAVLYIMDALEKTDYNEFLIQDAEAYASNAGGSWINQDYFKSVKSSQLIPDSDTVEYSVEDIMALGLNAAELRYARYEIYARHGMRTWDETANQRLSGVNNSNAAIAREKYMSYNDFGAYSTDDNNGLTEVERNNIRSIVQAELEQGMFIMEP